MRHPDLITAGNEIIRHYQKDGKFRDHSVDQTIALKLNNFKGWACAAAQESLYIDYDGFVFVANCRVNGPIGSIFDGFTIPGNEWLTCPKDFCGCGADIMIPKAQTPEERNLLANLNDAPLKEGVINRIEKLSAPVSAVEVSFRDNVKQVFWDLHRRCNYSCSYCWPEVHNNYEEVKPYHLLLKTTKQLIKDFGREKKLRFMFGGGEPTIIPNFLEWMNFIKSMGSYSVVTTNGSRSPEYFRELIKACSINLSVHFEFANVDRIFQNVEAMVEEKRNHPTETGTLEIKLMCPPGRVDDAIKLKEDLFKIPGFSELVPWSVVPIRSIEDNQFLVNYDEKEFERLKEQIKL